MTADLRYRSWRLSDILAVEDTGEPFDRDPGFSLETCAKRSFGVFQEAPFDIARKFTPHAAVDARDCVFHPDQSMEELPDGSLIARFRASGALEIKWHLYT